MKSSLFNVELDENTGCVTAITVLSDPHKMNWCSSLCQWGRINIECRRTDPYHSSFVTPLTLDGFSSDGSSSVSVYKNNLYSITVSRYFSKNGNLVENVRIKNIFHKPVTVNRDNFAIAFPFNDRYTHADDCLTGRCNTHFWCGINTCYVNALKMGASAMAASDGCSWWWLRSDKTAAKVPDVDSDGSLSTARVNGEKAVVRPAIWILY